MKRVSSDIPGKLVDGAFVCVALIPLALLVSNVAAELLTVTTAVLFLLRCWRDRVNFLRAPDVACLITVWLVLNLVVSPAADDVAGSFGRSLPMLRLILLYAALSTWLAGYHERVRLLCGWYAVLVVAVVGDMVLQLTSGESLLGNPLQWTRVTGPLDRPGVGAVLGKLGLPAAAGLLLSGRSRIAAGTTITAVTLVVVLTAGVIISGDRNEAILTLAGLMICLFALASAGPGKGRWAAAGAGAVVVISAMILRFNEYSRIRFQFLAEQILHFQNTDYYRIFSSAWQVFRGDPLTGAGLKGYRTACSELLATDQVSFCALHPHNIYLEWLSEAGILATAGFILFVTLIATVMLGLWRCGGTRRIVAGLLTAALMISLFPIAASRSFFSNWPAILMWTSLGLSVGIARLALAEDSPE